MPL
ncbi:hypothetical protein YPPY15_4446, partial [Yersinia pestis PY-15]|jgi:hypothetical protein